MYLSEPGLMHLSPLSKLSRRTCKASFCVLEEIVIGLTWPASQSLDWHMFSLDWHMFSFRHKDWHMFSFRQPLVSDNHRSSKNFPANFDRAS